MRAIKRLLLLSMCCFAGSVLASPMQFSWSPGPLYSGTNWSVSFNVVNTTGGTLTGPFTVRTYLPEHMQYVRHYGTAWTCAQEPGQPRQINCVWTGTLTAAQWSAPAVSIETDVAPDIPLTTHELRATVETPTVPAPDPAQCTGSPSTTGCLVWQMQALASRLYVTGWGYGHEPLSGPGPVAEIINPFEAGNERRVMLQFVPVGYGPSNTPVTARFHLPAGLAYSRMQSSLPGFTCSVEPDGGGELVTCSTPYIVNNSYITFVVDVATDVPIPGPLYVYARLGNDSQDLSLAQCIADPARDGCGRLTVPTRLPRAARLELVSAAPLPAEFQRGQEGRVRVLYRNSGDDVAVSTRLALQLPPGLAWNRMMGLAMACTASGDPATVGQIVACTGPALPDGLQLQPDVVVDVLYGAVDDLPILLAVDMGQGAAQAVLDGCVADPAQAHCALIDVPVAFHCADQHGAEGIFCNGFELPPTR